MNLSSPFVSRVLSGKSDLPLDRVADFVTHLKIDKISENRLLRSYENPVLQELKEEKTLSGRHEEVMADYIELADKEFHLLERWYFIAILDLAGCRNYSDDPAWIGKRLGISEAHAKEALRFLKAGRFLIQDDGGRWIKSHKQIRIPTKESRQLIRQYHEAMSDKAVRQLNKFTSPEDFSRRLITGISTSANPKQLAKAMDRLNQAMYEIAEILRTGDCSEVYHLNIQLFPITRHEKD